MADQSVTCPTCGKKIPLTKALRADIEDALKRQFEHDLTEQERRLRESFERTLESDRERVLKEALTQAERKLANDLAAMRHEITEQARELEEARRQELALRKRERDLERQRQDLEVALARQLDAERQKIIEETQTRVTEAHRLKDAEKERQLLDMRRQIDELRRKAEQGSQQLQGEAGEMELESTLRDLCRSDEIHPISQGVRGADLHHLVLDARGVRAGAILWECKNTRHWSDTWIPKLKADQRTIRADLAVLVTACLPKGVSRFAYIDGVLVTDFASVAGVAAIGTSPAPLGSAGPPCRGPQGGTTRAAPSLSDRHRLPPPRRGRRRSLRVHAAGPRPGAPRRRTPVGPPCPTARRRDDECGRDVRGPAGTRPCPAANREARVAGRG